MIATAMRQRVSGPQARRTPQPVPLLLGSSGRLVGGGVPGRLPMIALIAI